MRARNYVIFGLFIILSSVLVSAGSFLIKGKDINKDTVVRLDHGDVIIQGGKIISSEDSGIELIPLTPKSILSNTLPVTSGVRIRKNSCDFFGEFGVSYIGNYSCENGNMIVNSEFIVKLG